MARFDTVSFTPGAALLSRSGIIATSNATRGQNPYLTIDSNLTTGWAACWDGAGSPQDCDYPANLSSPRMAYRDGVYVQYQFPGPVSLRAISMRWYNSGTRTYRFAIKVPDGQGGWTPLFEGHSNGYALNGQPDGDELYKFAPVTTSQLRIEGYGFSYGPWVNINDVQFYGPSPDADNPKP
jgi:hypothetical protein